MKKYENGTFGRILAMLKTHITTCLLGGIISLAAGWWMIGSSFHFLFSIIYTAIYAFIIFSSAWQIGNYDIRSYVGEWHNWKKGILLSLGIAGWSLLVWIMYEYSWAFLVMDGKISTFSGITYKMIFSINTLMYSGFFDITEKSIPFYGHILIYLIPMLMTALGYIFGTTNTVPADKLERFIYEDEKKEL